MTLQIEPTLRPFFEPAGIVVVGVSSSPDKLGFGVARNLHTSGYPGAIHFVNPRGGRLLDQPVYPTVAEVPDPVDLAVVVVPAEAVAATLATLGERGIRAAIIVSGGFGETGPDGVKREQEALAVARRYGLRLIGPNCIGLLDSHLPLDTTFLAPPGPAAGDVAFISHSGALCAAVIDWSRDQGFGFSQLISLGNQIDLIETDLLTSVAANPATRVLTLYLEGIGDGRRFIQAAQQVSAHKPLIALKAGRFAAGQRAIASHTGALAGENAAFDAAFRRAGVIRATTIEEMFDWARALAWCPLPAGPNVAVLTNAGGPGVTAADALESHGLRLAALAPATTDRLRGLLPAAAGLGNPVDMLASATAEQYADSLHILLDDPNVDSVLVILPPPPMESAGRIAAALAPIITAAAKPVVVALMGERLIRDAAAILRAAQVAEYRFPERAAAALAVLARYRAVRHSPRPSPLPGQTIFGPVDAAVGPAQPERAAAILRNYRATLDPAAKGNVSLPYEVIAGLLAAYGIPTAPVELAATANAAAAAACRIGFPVALKIASDDIVHKSDVGGVRLGIDSPEAAAAGFRAILDSGRRAMPEARIAGVYVQTMVSGGQEVIIGTTRDAHFGPLVLFGSGGVEVEGLKDVAMALAPIPPDELEELLAATWAGRRLAGFRHLPPADRAAVGQIIRQLAQLAADFPQLVEMELNPVRVMAAGQGAVAVDMRARLEL